MKTIGFITNISYLDNKVTDPISILIYDHQTKDVVEKHITNYDKDATFNLFDEIEYTKEELAKVADYLLKYKVDAAFAIGNIGNETISISARSKEKVDVGAVMQELSGGGNQFSGATKLTDCSIEEAEKRLVKILQPPCYIK